MIYYLSYESAFCFEIVFTLKTGIAMKVRLVRKRDIDFKSGYVRKWKTWHCIDNGQGFYYKKISFYNFDFRP